MTNLIQIKEKIPNQETIKLVEKLLEKAKSGEMQQILVATINCDHVISYNYSNDLTIQNAVFAMINLKLTIEDLIRANKEIEN